MCQAKPGLRCATHARQKVQYYQERITEKAQQLTQEVNDRQRNSLQRSISNFSKKLEDAQLEYGLTDQGFKEMKQKHAQNHDPALGEKIKEYGLLRRRRKQAYTAYNSTAHYGNYYSRATSEDLASLKDTENASLKELEQQVKDEEQNLKALQESLFAKSMSTAPRVPGLTELGQKTGLAHSRVVAAKQYVKTKKILNREGRTPIDLDQGSWHNASYASGVEYDYDTYYNHEEAGCDEEGICRCGTIENAHVTSVDAQAFLQDAYHRQRFPQEISDYAQTVGLTDPDNWEVASTGGYYGDEIDSVRFDNPAIQHDVEEKIKAWNYRNYDEQAVTWTPESNDVKFAIGDKVKVVDGIGRETEGTVSQTTPFKILNGMTETTAVTETGIKNSNILAVYK